MNILLLGSGGREHALAWKMAASPLSDRLICAPGNAGIAREAECVALDIADHAAVIAFCRQEQHRSRRRRAGGAALRRHRRRSRGRRHQGLRAEPRRRPPRRLQGLSPRICAATNGIPTAAYERFRAAEPAKAYVRERGAPIVVKADGLAAGKGVVVAEDLAAAERGDRHDVRRRPGRGRRRDRDRGIPRRRGGVVLRALRWRDRICRLPRRRITSAPSTATKDRIPAAWAPTRRRRSSMRRRARGSWRRSCSRRLRAMKAMGAPYKGVLFAGADAHRRGSEADRIQCPLRRSGMPGADAAPDVGSRSGAAGAP